jgi:hypothetical protein
MGAGHDAVRALQVLEVQIRAEVRADLAADGDAVGLQPRGEEATARHPALGQVGHVVAAGQVDEGCDAQ